MRNTPNVAVPASRSDCPWKPLLLTQIQTKTDRHDNALESGSNGEPRTNLLATISRPLVRRGRWGERMYGCGAPGECSPPRSQEMGVMAHSGTTTRRQDGAYTLVEM